MKAEHPTFVQLPWLTLDRHIKLRQVNGYTSNYCGGTRNMEYIWLAWILTLQRSRRKKLKHFHLVCKQQLEKMSDADDEFLLLFKAEFS